MRTPTTMWETLSTCALKRKLSPLSLSGKARSWYRCFRADDPRWESLRADFCSHFSPLWCVVSLSVRTLSFKQGKEESLATWCYLWRLVHAFGSDSGKEILGGSQEIDNSNIQHGGAPLGGENIESSRAIISRVRAFISTILKAMAERTLPEQ